MIRAGVVVVGVDEEARARARGGKRVGGSEVPVGRLISVTRRGEVEVR